MVQRERSTRIEWKGKRKREEKRMEEKSKEIGTQHCINVDLEMSIESLEKSKVSIYVDIYLSHSSYHHVTS